METAFQALKAHIAQSRQDAQARHMVELLALAERHPIGRAYEIEHDGFAGYVIGYYFTFEGKPGVVLQQDGTRIVHVYGEKWLKG